MNKVGKIILGILFVLVIGGLVGYVVWKSSDKKENDEPKKTPEATISVEEKTWTKEEIAKTVIPFFNQVYGKGYNNVEEMQDESVFWSIVYLLVNELSKEEYPWEFRKLPFTASDNIRNARYPKIMYYDVLPGYKEYLWIDSNIDLLSNLLYEDVNKLRKSGAEFAISRHPHRDCIYEEAEICIKMQKDNPEIIRKQCRFLKEEGYPEHFGLFENNVIYRKDTPDNRKVSQTWWEMLNRFSRRDQLSLMYAVWKTQTPKPLPMNEHSYRNLLGDTLVRKHFQKRVKAC